MPSTLLSAVSISTANPNRDGSGASSAVVSTLAYSVGVRIDVIRMEAIGPTTAGMLRLFFQNTSGAKFLIAEIPVAAATPSATDPAWSATYVPQPITPNGLSTLILPVSQAATTSLLVATENAETFHVTAFGQNL